MLHIKSIALLLLLIVISLADEYQFLNIENGSEWIYVHTYTSIEYPTEVDTFEITLDSKSSNGSDETFHFSVKEGDSTWIDSVVLSDGSITYSLRIKSLPLFYQCNTSDTKFKSYYEWDESSVFNGDTSIHIGDFTFDNEDINQLKYTYESTYWDYSAKYLSGVGLISASSSTMHHGSDTRISLKLIATNTITSDLLHVVNGTTALIEEGEIVNSDVSVTLAQLLSGESMYAFQVYNVHGRMVQSNGTLQGLTALPKGIYLLKGIEKPFRFTYRNR